MRSEQRFERVTNLTALLLHTRRGLTMREIVDQVPGYPPGRAACRQAFERDKRVLREEGIPLVETDGRYLIPPDEYYLRDIELTPAERAALNLAVAAVSVDGGAARRGVAKLGGLDAEPGAVPLRAQLVDLPALPALHAAARQRAAVRFTYRGELRTVEPVGLLFRDGNWYLAAYDRDRGAERRFRVDRIEGEVDVDVAGSADHAGQQRFDARNALTREPWRFGGEEPVTAVVEVDALLAVRVAAELGDHVVRERRPDGAVVVAFAVTNREAFRSWVLGLLDHARVVGPPDLRDEVVGWLRAVAACRP